MTGPWALGSGSSLRSRLQACEKLQLVVNMPYINLVINSHALLPFYIASDLHDKVRALIPLMCSPRQGGESSSAGTFSLAAERKLRT